MRKRLGCDKRRRGAAVVFKPRPGICLAILPEEGDGAMAKLVFWVRDIVLMPGGYKAMERPHRLATAKEVEAAQALPGAPHVTFGCTGCGKAGWSAKNIALADNGGYDGSRSIFWHGTGRECDCPSHMIRMVVDDGTGNMRAASE